MYINDNKNKKYSFFLILNKCDVSYREFWECPFPMNYGDSCFLLKKKNDSFQQYFTANVLSSSI